MVGTEEPEWVGRQHSAKELRMGLAGGAARGSG